MSLSSSLPIVRYYTEYDEYYYTSTSLATTVSLGNIPFRYRVPVYLKRIVSSSATQITPDACVLTITNAIP